MRRESKYRTNQTLRKNIGRIDYQRYPDDPRPLPQNRTLPNHQPGAKGADQPEPKEGMENYTPDRIFDSDHISANKPWGCKGYERRSPRKWWMKKKRYTQHRKRRQLEEKVREEYQKFELGDRKSVV